MSAVPCRHSMQTVGGTDRAISSIGRLQRLRKSCRCSGVEDGGEEAVL